MDDMEEDEKKIIQRSGYEEVYIWGRTSEVDERMVDTNTDDGMLDTATRPQADKTFLDPDTVQDVFTSLFPSNDLSLHKSMSHSPPPSLHYLRRSAPLAARTPLPLRPLPQHLSPHNLRGPQTRRLPTPTTPTPSTHRIPLIPPPLPLLRPKQRTQEPPIILTS
jgi:hypothetical protein